MNGLGFGLERIGIAALARPVIFATVLAAMTIIAALNIPSVKFNGNVTSVVPQTSENFINFENQKRDFRNFARDVAIIIKSPRIQTASGMEDLRIMQLELAISDGINSAISMFSVPELDRETGELRPFFPAQIESDQQAAELIARLKTQYPQANSLISAEDNAALILVSLDLGIDVGNDKQAYATFQQMQKAAEEVAPEDFKLYYSGLTPIGLTILETLIQDQVKLTLLGLAIGASIAMVFFRSLVAAFLCFVPPLLTAVWSIGLFSIVDVPITYLTTILPALALVLAYADGIVLYHRWAKLNAEGDEVDQAQIKENLARAIRRIGPASALTSITTAFAISSFAFSKSEALFEFAWLGVILVIFAFIAVITAIPLLGLALLKMGLVKSGRNTRRRYSFGRIVAIVYSKVPGWVCLGATLSSIALFYVHAALEPNYNIVDYLPRSSETLAAENLSNKIFGGRSMMFLTVPVVEKGEMNSKLNRDRLAEVTELLERSYGAEKVFSLHSVWKQYDEAEREKIALQLADPSPETRRGYVSRDGSRMLVSLRLPSDRTIVELGEITNDVRSLVDDNLEYSEDIVLTGFPVLLAIEFTKMINELRVSLLVAVAIGIVLIGVATRSVFYSVVAAVPNVFPILLVELFIYLNGGNINVTEVVALTLAFGIAIDNAVHVINVFHAERAKGMDTETALRNAIVEVAPALGASTLIICVSNIAILTSILPILPIIGKLIIAILVVALFTNLIILPSNILTLSKGFAQKR